MSFLIELLTHKLANLFRKSTTIGQKLGIKSVEKLDSVKCEMGIFYFCGVSTLLIETLSLLS